MHGGTRAMNNQPTPTLEQRIASALNAAAITSSDLDTLIAESEAAAAAADLAAAKAREAALDPAVVVDTAKMGAAVATATLSRDRLQAALPRLQQQLKQAREREYTAAWREDSSGSRRSAMRRRRSMPKPIRKWWSGSLIFSTVSRPAIAKFRTSTVAHHPALALTCARSS
jgi:hypothetical protein